MILAYRWGFTFPSQYLNLAEYRQRLIFFDSRNNGNGHKTSVPPARFDCIAGRRHDAVDCRHLPLAFHFDQNGHRRFRWKYFVRFSFSSQNFETHVTLQYRAMPRSERGSTATHQTGRI